MYMYAQISSRRLDRFDSQRGIISGKSMGIGNAESGRQLGLEGAQRRSGQSFMAINQSIGESLLSCSVLFKVERGMGWSFRDFFDPESCDSNCPSRGEQQQARQTPCSASQHVVTVERHLWGFKFFAVSSQAMYECTWPSPSPRA